MCGAVLAQQRLIALLEVQRDAEADKAALLARERDELAAAHRQVGTSLLLLSLLLLLHPSHAPPCALSPLRSAAH